MRSALFVSFCPIVCQWGSEIMLLIKEGESKLKSLA